MGQDSIWLLPIMEPMRMVTPRGTLMTPLEDNSHCSILRIAWLVANIKRNDHAVGLLRSIRGGNWAVISLP
jgi:hypothetical protein